MPVVGRQQRSEVSYPPGFADRGDAHQIKQLADSIPFRWKNGERDSVGSIGEMLGSARDLKLYEKVGCQSWEDYCQAYLNDPSAAFDELIAGVRILRSKGVQGPISEAEARRTAADRARVDASERPQGVRTDLMEDSGADGLGLGAPELPYNEGIIRKLSDKGGDGGTHRGYLLRRMVRDRPDILEAWERGEYRSVRAAAIAAKFITPARPWLGRMNVAWDKNWPNMTEEEQDAFLREHGLKRNDCGGFHADDKG